MKTARFLIALAAAALLWSCSPLSDEAKQIVGNYYIPELSNDEPMLELDADGTCHVHAIKKGVLSYSVPGEWNVRDSIIIFDLDPAGLTFEGDSALIGDIPRHMEKTVREADEFSLTLEVDGIDYVYQRRNPSAED